MLAAGYTSTGSPENPVVKSALNARSPVVTELQTFVPVGMGAPGLTALSVQITAISDRAVTDPFPPQLIAKATPLVTTANRARCSLCGLPRQPCTAELSGAGAARSTTAMHVNPPPHSACWMNADDPAVLTL